jgi:hypothetical protein
MAKLAHLQDDIPRPDIGVDLLLQRVAVLHVFSQKGLEQKCQARLEHGKTGAGAAATARGSGALDDCAPRQPTHCIERPDHCPGMFEWEFSAGSEAFFSSLRSLDPEFQRGKIRYFLVASRALMYFCLSSRILLIRELSPSRGKGFLGG